MFFRRSSAALIAPRAARRTAFAATALAAVAALTACSGDSGVEETTEAATSSAPAPASSSAAVTTEESATPEPAVVNAAPGELILGAADAPAGYTPVDFYNESFGVLADILQDAATAETIDPAQCAPLVYSTTGITQWVGLPQETNAVAQYRADDNAESFVVMLLSTDPDRLSSVQVDPAECQDVTVSVPLTADQGTSTAVLSVADETQQVVALNEQADAVSMVYPTRTAMLLNGEAVESSSEQTQFRALNATLGQYSLTVLAVADVPVEVLQQLASAQLSRLVA